MSNVKTWIIAGLVVVIAFGAGAYVFNPVRYTVDNVGAPVAREIGVTSSRCGNFNDASDLSGEQPVYACEKGDWRVILSTDGKSFERAYNKNEDSGWITDETKVPGWK